MSRIKIIHISDILIGLPHTDVNSRVNHIQQAANNFELKNSDYLVISGNITYDGNARSFEQAREFINRIASILLTKDGQNIRLNRVVIVPGKNDIAEPAISEAHYSNFKSFHDNLFEQEISEQRCEEFKYDRALVRELKDITIIGACCWQNNSDGEIDGISQRRIKPIYEAADSQISSLRYANSTPTILVTSEIPLQAWSLTQAYAQRLRELFINNLKITVNLFGSGNASCINPEPFSFRHISIGTGPRANREIWPLRMNLIEINLQTNLNIKVTGFQKSGNIIPWEAEEFLNQPLNSYQRIQLNTSSNRWNSDELCTEFLEIIEDKNPSFRPGIVFVKGFPGSLKETIFQHYQKIINVRNQDLFVIGGRLKSYGNIDNENVYENNFNEYKQEFIRIQRILEDFNTIHNSSIKRVIVLYDSALANTDNSEIVQALSQVRYDLSSFRDSTIVYITQPRDLTTDFESHCIEVLELTTFPTSLNQLVEQYCYQLPVSSEHINCLAGGYFEFSNLLLQESKSTFFNWSGSEPINRKTSEKLIEQTINNSRLIQERSKIFRKTIEKNLGGTEVFRYIQRLVRRSISDREGSFHEKLNSIYIRVPELKRELKSEIKDAALRVINLLEKHGILENIFYDVDTYRLKLVMPFLISVDMYNVFISFPATLKLEAEYLSNMLVQIAEFEGKSINSWVFTQRIGETSSVTQRINEALRNSKNLIVLFEEREFSSPYTEGEYSTWERHWRPRARNNDARCIPVALRGISTEIPYPFNASDIIDASSGITRENATQILNLLIPDDNSV
ncbi:metallophosphoesterase [Dendronalium sp. ChiSLP03b]|uniref:metallophosphoesterase n=1 Tax=Dendronalium sp. ChiSLP03b TaxID=3075381 RepID=UPI002AD289D3|nr:metallophosphoesterase [Dendronalium sp. ChiSLP03b]MDZ8205918.1 metallophosphoesterase [Dendronalium sp. ChiSLP03b]